MSSEAWLVLWTPFGTEVNETQLLQSAEVDAYCPVMRVRKRHHRTKKRIYKEFPAFPTYLFARPQGGLAELLWLKTADGLRQMRMTARPKSRPVLINEKPAIIPDQAITRIKALEERWMSDRKKKRAGQIVFIGDKVSVQVFGHTVDAVVRSVGARKLIAEGDVAGKKFKIEQPLGA